MNETNKTSGYRRQYRSLMNHPLHPSKQKRPFTEYEALLDILDSAAGKNRKRQINKRIIAEPRGCWIASLDFLRQRWHWKSKGKVKRFLTMLEGNETIASEPVFKNPSIRDGTLIRTLNYHEYNPLGDSAERQTERQRNTKRNGKRNAKPQDAQSLEQFSGTANGTPNGTNIIKDISNTVPCAEIIDDLNRKAGTKYKSTSDKSQRFIRARWNEGFDLEDFKQVNSVKTKDWLGTDKQKFLRPETLYGTKFEGYLNQRFLEERHSVAQKTDGSRVEPRYQDV